MVEMAFKYKKSNKQKSRIQSRVEHVFGFIEGTLMCGLLV